MQPQAKKHVTMDCDGGRRGRWREKGRSDRGLSIIGNQARYHLDREEVLIVLLINKQTNKENSRKIKCLVNTGEMKNASYLHSNNTDL